MKTKETNEQLSKDYNDMQSLLLSNSELKAMLDGVDIDLAKQALKFATLFGMACKKFNEQPTQTINN